MGVHCNVCLVFCQLKFNICVRCDVAFNEPMHRNKPNITYLLLTISFPISFRSKRYCLVVLIFAKLLAVYHKSTQSLHEIWISWNKVLREWWKFDTLLYTACDNTMEPILIALLTENISGRIKCHLNTHSRQYIFCLDHLETSREIALQHDNSNRTQLTERLP